MPLTPVHDNQLPDFWTTYGHSYLQVSYGTLFSSGRMDSLFRATLDVEFTNWIGRAVDGSRLTAEGRSQGGFTRVYQEMTTLRTAGPYTSDAGAHLLCWGINDLGVMGVATLNRTAWKNCLRAVISRCRAAAVFADSHASISYGAGFTSTLIGDFGNGTTAHHATATPNANFTITIPADYKGETIAMSFIGLPAANTGVVTWSGTAGLTGTVYPSNASPAGNHGPVVVRYVAPVTGSTQTIIGTVTSLDAGGDVSFNCWWLESIAPPVVLVCNIARLTATGYTSYGGWAGTEAAKDINVQDFNTDTVSVIAEFDSMVQLVDIDLALSKDVTLFGADGVHPNELGNSKCADAISKSLQQCRPTSIYGTSAHFNPSSRRAGSLGVNRLSGQWYTTDFRLVGAAYTPVSGDQFSIPIYVTAGRERWIQLAVELVTSTVATTWRWGVYDDRGSDSGIGYPQNLLAELTSAGVYTATTGAGAKVSPAAPGAGSINMSVDPGLYWLVIKFCTIGTSTVRTISGPCPQMPNLNTTGAVLNTTGGPIGYKLTGQGTTALPTIHVAAGALTDPVPYVGVKLF